ncbi:MAG TPA: anion transporter [Casimicrobiaceae bacterium]|nr:anion transporter [Casimicrobiaceae bacterium]
MTTTIVAIFLIVYLGMILGELPFLQIDRTGVALLGAIALVSLDAVSLQEAAESVHLPTIILFFSFMVLSAQMRLGGFYDWVTRRLAAFPLSPPLLLGAVMLAVAALSAVFSNDIVCLAIAPVLIHACTRLKLDPVPYLLALACAANIGSAWTLIGNPQNMLIGQTLRMSFAGYSAEAALPVALGLIATWGLIAWQSRGRWGERGEPSTAVMTRATPVAGDDEAPLDRWQTTKGLVIAGVLLVAFVLSPLPREHVALTAAGVLLMSRKLHTTRTLGLVDWELLILFIGLFVVNHALQRTGLATAVVNDFAQVGFDLRQPAPLFAGTFVLSNLVSNVPAVMLLLPFSDHAFAGPLLALVSTLAGNLLIVGSIANIIVVDAARRRGIHIDWHRHARVGVPVTLVTLAITAIYLWLRIL